MLKVYLTDHPFPSTEPERTALAGLAEVIDLSASPPRTEDELTAACRDAAALIVGFVPVTARVMDALAGLRCIVRYGIGCDTIDTAAAAELGILVANVPDYCVSEVADHAMALLLALARKTLVLDAYVRGGGWGAVKAARPLRRIGGRTLGLIGFGRIGREVALRARAFGYRILVYDKYLSAEAARASGAEPAGFEELLASADALSIHAPLTQETEHLIDAKALSMMKPEAVIVNVARGAIVDTAALAEALAAGKISGAALDVYETEPLPRDHPILKAPNTVLQPHAAWYSEESLLQLQRDAAEETARFLRGESLKHPVNDPPKLRPPHG